MADAQELIRELIKLASRLSCDEKETWKRVRYAVSPAELQRIKQYLGYAGRPDIVTLRGIQLVVESEPTTFPLRVEIE